MSRRCGAWVSTSWGSWAPTRLAPPARPSPPRVYDDLDALLADPTVDVVHIATPDHLHAPQVRDVLAAGKHVVCEKPLALTSEDAAELVALADAAGKVHGVFQPAVLSAAPPGARERGVGQIGTPRFITGHYLQDWLLLDTDWNWRLVPDEAARCARSPISAATGSTSRGSSPGSGSWRSWPTSTRSCRCGAIRPGPWRRSPRSMPARSWSRSG